jgi:hypothetical protein
LDSHECSIIAWEEGLAAFAHALGGVRMECDASCTRADVVQRDFFTQARASSSWSEKLTDLCWTPKELQILLCL